MCGLWQKWLEGHIAPSPPPPPHPPPPPESQVRGQGIHMVISLRDFRDASLENISGPSFELRNSNYASWCKYAYTQSKIP